MDSTKLSTWIYRAVGIGIYFYSFFTLNYLLFFHMNIDVAQYLPHSMAQHFSNYADKHMSRNMIEAIFNNLLLLFIFVLQHTIMARPAFKEATAKLIPNFLSRTLFVLAASLCVWHMIDNWQSFGGTIWDIQSPSLRMIIHAISVAGYGFLFATTFVIDHFELFGVKQSWFNSKYIGRSVFKVVYMYKLVRHPMMLGFIVFLWSVPTMTLGHLMFSACLTAYIFFGTQLEEKDLVREFPIEYPAYQKSVPGICPIRFFSSSSSVKSTAVEAVAETNTRTKVQ